MSVGAMNNPTAFSVYTNYAASTSKLSQSMGRLATGVKSVVDDGAGVGISERMRSQARSTAMARSNVENGISALKTADGWMQRMSDMTSRMHELAIEAMDATKTSTDLTNINAEFTQLGDEVERVRTSAAKFNGANLLDDSFGAKTQVGADSGQTINLSVGTLDHVASVTDLATDTRANASTAMVTLNNAINGLATARARVGGLQSRLSHSRAGLLSYEDNIRSAESKIRDVDMARESSEMSKQQILSQVGNAMLAQANQLPGGVLQLLG
jgi:flagellin